jgi:hypothetical protein
VLRQQPPEHPWDATWAFLIVPISAERSRLLSRSRTVKTPGAAGVAARIGAELMGPIILLMTRKMLLGIKERAEHQGPRSSAEPRPLPSGTGHLMAARLVPLPSTSI